MKTFDTSDIRNITLVGHSGSGKTSFAEAMIFEAGTTNRLGNVNDGNTVSDFHEIEQERGNSIFTSQMYASWKNSKINILDTPGLIDFVGEVVSSLKVSDTAVMMLNAQNGVEVGSEMIWEYIESFETPTIFVVNQIDQDKADFDTTLEQAKSRFGSKVIPMQYPLNQGNGFNTIVDALKMVMYVFPSDGGKPEKQHIPDSEIAKAQQMHNAIVEAAAENDETLMEIFFDKGSLDEEEMVQGLRVAIANQQCYPVFVCSSTRNMGSGRVMGFIHDICPSPSDTPDTVLEDGNTLPNDPNGPLSLFIFKTASEPNLGIMSYFKVISGTLTVGSDLTNAYNNTHERLNQIYLINGKNRENANSLKAGDLGVTVKLKNSHTNQTLNEKGIDYKIKPIVFPEPLMLVAVKPPNKSDIEKMATALHALEDEDPTLKVEQSSELKQTLLHGMGQLHLDIVKWKVAHNFKVDIEFEKPRIPFRETIQKAAKTNYRHKKQTGGAGQFGEVHMLIEPYYEGMPDPEGLNVRNTQEIQLDWGGKLVFLWCIVGGAVDNKYVNAIIKGVMQKMEDGPLTGSYCRDIRVSVYDGKMHPVDSNDMAFQIAGAMAFKIAFQEASPQIMEPIYEVEVMVSEDVTGDVMSDLQSRRAIIQGIEAEGHYQKLKAKVPLLELHKYNSTLRSISQGRAKYKRRFLEYAPVPHEIQQELISSHQSELQES